ncbi:MAG: VirB4 family type IV secretion system protein [Oscillochloridaceae bacterium umkhey_bin13]
MQIIKLTSFPLEQEEDLDGLEQRLAAWFAARDYPCRLLAVSQAFSMRPPINRVRADQASMAQLQMVAAPLFAAIDATLEGRTDHDPSAVLAQLAPAQREVLQTSLAASPRLQALLADPGSRPAAAWVPLGDALDRALWRLPWTKEAIRFYEALEQRHLRASSYTLLTWEPPEVSAQALLTTLRHAFGRPAARCDQLPSVIGCAYREHSTRLEPLEPGHPWLAVLHSYDLQGLWDAGTLHPLLATSYDVALAIDIVTLSRAQRMAELAFNAANLVAGDQRLLDTRAERVTHDAQYALHELRHQTLHEIQLAVLVGGATADELETNVADVRDRLGPRLRMMRAAGAQAEVLRLFSATPRARIEAPWKPRTQLSHAVGCLAGIVGLHRTSATDGIFLGVDAVRRAPVFMDLFKHNQAAHTLVLGKSGSGKTVFINLLAERAAAVAGMQVIGIDAFENGFRVAAALRGAACYAVGLEHTVNILDVVFGEETEGGWLPNQVLHVVGQLALLFGQPGRIADRECYLPRAFSTRERGVLGRVVQDLYLAAGVTPATPVTEQPVLADLLALLEQDGGVTARELALDLRYLIYGTEQREATRMTPEGAAFNGPTTIDWNFRSDVTYYDFKQVPAILRPFYYLQAIGAINRYLRLPGRDRRRKIFLEIDEFGYASQVEEVVRLAHDISKTARKYGCGIVLVDQNPSTFLGTETGRQIYEQAAARIFFRLEDTAAREVGAALGDLTPAHLAFLPQAQPGECLAVLKNDVYHVNIEMSPREAEAFMGS